MTKNPATISIAHWVANLSYSTPDMTSWIALIDSQLARAKSEGADLLLIPEHISEYWIPFAPKDLPLTDEPAWAATQGEQALPLLQDAVKRHGVALAAGSFSMRDAATGQCRNRAFVLFPDRDMVVHDKFVMTPSEKDPEGWTFETGSTLTVFNWRGLRVALIICLDVEMPHLAHRAASLDIDLLLVPSMTSKLSGYHRVFSCARARAVELMTAVCVTGCVAGREGYHGGASVFIPSEEAFGHTGIFAELPVHNNSQNAGEWLLAKDIPVGAIRTIRHGDKKAEAWPGPWDASHVKINDEGKNT